MLGFLTLSLAAQSSTIARFVDQYKEIAIQEMHRTGIPASVKLGQAILESESGQSELATKSNNFFGLKCGPSWEGETYYKKDDDRDRRGRLIKSCFRAFQNPDESFIEHSEFLMHPKKAYRYGFLFNLDRHDYKSWAWGLKESGYATNPRYAILLISIIEKNGLYTFDYYETEPALVMVSRKHEPKPTFRHTSIEHRTIRTQAWRNSIKNEDVIDAIVMNNGLKLVYAKAHDTPRELSVRFNIPLAKILGCNERLLEADQPLAMAERVYFEKKKKSYRGDKKYHQVSTGESMYDIAQQYGITLEKLYIRNRMHPGGEPAVGERIILRGKVKFKDRPKLSSARKSYQRPLPIPHRIAKVDEIKHIVEKGDTLYRIASRYQVSLESLKKRNDLESNMIKPGQVLFIGS